MWGSLTVACGVAALLGYSMADLAALKVKGVV